MLIEDANKVMCEYVKFPHVCSDPIWLYMNDWQEEAAVVTIIVACRSKQLMFILMISSHKQLYEN